VLFFEEKHVSPFPSREKEVYKEFVIFAE